MTKNACPRGATNLSKAKAKNLLSQKDGVARLVQFHSPYCGHCEEVTPEIHKAARELCGDAEVCRVNVDTNEELADALQVEGLPTVAVVKDGKVLAKIEGAGEGATSDDFQKLINKYLGK